MSILHTGLFFLDRRLGQSCAGVHTLAQVSTAIGRLCRGTGETCGECLGEVLGSGDCRLRSGMLSLTALYRPQQHLLPPYSPLVKLRAGQYISQHENKRREEKTGAPRRAHAQMPPAPPPRP